MVFAFPRYTGSLYQDVSISLSAGVLKKDLYSFAISSYLHSYASFTSFLNENFLKIPGNAFYHSIYTDFLNDFVLFKNTYSSHPFHNSVVSSLNGILSSMGFNSLIPHSLDYRNGPDFIALPYTFEFETGLKSDKHAISRRIAFSLSSGNVPIVIVPNRSLVPYYRNFLSSFDVRIFSTADLLVYFARNREKQGFSNVYTRRWAKFRESVR